MRRSDLYKRSQSSSPAPSEPDPELEAQLRERLASLYSASFDPTPVSHTFTSKAERPPQKEVEDEEDDDAEQVFEFRLFSGGKGEDKVKAEPQKITLEDEEGEGGEGGFVRSRDPRVWIVGRAVGERKVQFETAAISGDEILRRRADRDWGLEIPWRVRVVKIREKLKPGQKGEKAVKELEEVVEEGKRKKPGKKRRIVLRQRKKKIEEDKERRRKEKELKEETEKEKRTRRNREKKVKRRLKEKAKKAGGGRNGEEGDVAIGGQDVSLVGEDDGSSFTD